MRMSAIRTFGTKYSVPLVDSKNSFSPILLQIFENFRTAIPLQHINNEKFVIHSVYHFKLRDEQVLVIVVAAGGDLTMAPGIASPARWSKKAFLVDSVMRRNLLESNSNLFFIDDEERFVLAEPKFTAAEIMQWVEMSPSL